MVVDYVQGRVPILMGCGGYNTAAVVEELKTGDFRGVDGILSICPYYNKPSQFLVNVIWANCLSDMMVDEEGEALSIGLTNIIGFGFASVILASILFFVASLGWKTQSVNCPHIPF